MSTVGLPDHLPGLSIGQIWNGEASPKHKKSDTELALEELAKPLGPEVTVAEWLICQVKWSLFLGSAGALWGIGLNMRTYSEWDGYGDGTSSTPLPYSFIEIIMVSLAFAAPAIMTKCALRCYTHRYWYQAASFAVYVTLLAMLHYEVDTYHPSLQATGYRFHSKASQLLYTTPFEDVTGRSFETISTSGDFYTWMKGPLKNFIFSPSSVEAAPSSTTYNSIVEQVPMFAASSTLKVANWKIFAVEVRQLRVEPSTCPDYQDAVGLSMIGSGFQCMGPYSKGEESSTTRTSTFSGETYAPRSYKNWVGDEVDVGSVSGRFNLYPCNSGIRSASIKTSGGSSSGYLFSQGETPSITSYNTLVSSFETEGWVDALTRYVEVSITVANLNTNLRSTINLFIEADEAGNFQSGPFRVDNLLLSYKHPIALPTLVCLFVYMGELCENFLLPRVRGRGSKGLLSDDAVFNVLDIAIIITLIWFKAMDWEAMRLLPGAGTTSMSYATGTTSVMIQSSLYLFGTSVCFMIIKSFSFLRGVPSLERISATASGVVFKVGVLIAALGVVCYALGSMLHMLFKSNVHGFSGVGSSMVSVIRLFLGDFDTLENVLMAGPVYGFGAGFMAIVALVFYISIAFIVVATFLTILAESHAEAEQPLEIEPESVLTYGAHVTYETVEEMASNGVVGMMGVMEGLQTRVSDCCGSDKPVSFETVCCGIICCGDSNKAGDMNGVEAVGTPSSDDLAMVISANFDKYDIDQSGTINTVLEMTQLVTMLCVKLNINSNPTQVQRVIRSMGTLEDTNGQLNWTKDKFTNWFQHEFLDCWVNDVQSQGQGSGTHRELQSQENQPSGPMGVDVNASQEDVPALLMELDTLGDEAVEAEAPVEAQNAT